MSALQKYIALSLQPKSCRVFAWSATSHGGGQHHTPNQHAVRGFGLVVQSIYAVSAILTTSGTAHNYLSVHHLPNAAFFDGSAPAEHRTSEGGSMWLKAVGNQNKNGFAGWGMKSCPTSRTFALGFDDRL
ncbi:hypothetical protein [uncultured Brevundimonas sp.]|uniref:hypothetical protein n=1 Tax=uncultured Brevundimonas sp. TaxID=213418 RepID=UPI0025E81D8E|nr:hypothetical protein [uncultured Brevundimonas sp.]